MLAFFLAAFLSVFVFARGMDLLMSDALYFSEGEDTAIKASGCSDDEQGSDSASGYFEADQ